MLYLHRSNAVLLQHFRGYCYGCYLLCCNSAPERKSKREKDQRNHVHSCRSVCPEIPSSVISDFRYRRICPSGQAKFPDRTDGESCFYHSPSVAHHKSACLFRFYSVRQALFLYACILLFFFRQSPVKTGAVSGMASCTNLFYFCENCIVVAVNPKLLYILHMA